jgi:phosphopantetheine--protein transferase-like protein
MTASLWLLAGSASKLCTTLELERHLSDDERRRVATFGNAERRAQYTVGRAVLRQLLSSLVGIPGDDLELELEASGRPRLHPKHQSSVTFSITHTRDLVCWALHPKAVIGVDVEAVHRPREVNSLAERFFHPCERAFVASATTQTAAQRRFLQCWTLKEAWFKAFAGSQSLVLSELGFDLDITTKQASPVHDNPVPDLRLWSADWDDHVLALAWRGGSQEDVRCWRLEPSTLVPQSLRLDADFQFGTD